MSFFWIRKVKMVEHISFLIIGYRIRKVKNCYIKIMKKKKNEKSAFEN
jgi:hypothetical protein